MANSNRIKLNASWLGALGAEFEKSYMHDLRAFLNNELSTGKVVYPAMKNIFAAFDTTQFETVKVVILGQDPYHNRGQAHGLSFSVPQGIATPPSLRNIYTELSNDLDFDIPQHGCLQKWSEQGVLLLNTVLTVRAHEPGSHAGHGWETFTDKVIQLLAQRGRVVFMLWGRYAKAKKSLIDMSDNLILEAAHPSPMSVGGFRGCKHFSKANQWLQKHEIQPIDWQI